MKDPKAIRKAIMTARNIAAMVDPNFARVPLPQIGEPDYEEQRPPLQFSMGGRLPAQRSDNPFEQFQPQDPFSFDLPDHQYAAGGEVDDGQELTGYHGSANEFPEFNMEARGRGQGQAAFGEGHNFAEDEDVAGRYRRLTAREHGEGDIVHRITGERLPNDAPEAEMIKDASRTSHGLDHHIRITWPNTIAFTEKQNDDAEKSRAEVNDDNWLDQYIQKNRDRIETLKSAIEIAKTHNFEPKGHMYEVGLKVSPEKLLKWHEPVDAQPEEVQRHLIENSIEYTPDWTGKDIYHHLMEHPDKETKRLSSEQYSGKRANQILSDIGVHGIQWKDTDSQIAPGHGKNNYTIWDDSRIKTRRRYALGGMPDDDQPTDYSAPDDMGLYSHAAATAASFPQAKASPEEFRNILTNRGVKQSEFDASGYDKAFADQPQVTREQVAEHFHENRTPIEEKGFYDKDPRQAQIDAAEKEYWDSARELMARKVAYRDANPDADIADFGREESEALRRKLNEKRDALRESKDYAESAGEPHHEGFTLPGGENYREILLKHGGDDVRFPGDERHFDGEPNILTHLLMKDRTDAEGKRLLHLDELQSDWAQTGRQEGFGGPIDEDRYQKLAWNLDNSPEDEAEFEEMKKKIKGVGTAPYVTKTDDWVDLGLKRAMMEAAKGGHDKLAWSPGDVVADRYNLSKHISNIHHEKNDNGTYNVIAHNHKGALVYDQDGLSEKNVADALGKEVAEKILSGEGVGYEEAQARRKSAEDAHINFKKQLLELELQSRMDNVRKRNPEAQWDDDHIQMAKDVLEEKIANNTDAYANKFRLSDEHDAIADELKNAYSATKNSPHSPYRDWRTLSGVDLTIGGEGMKKFYDEMVPKRLMKLAKQHDPDAKFSVSTVEHPRVDEGITIPSEFGVSNSTTDLPTLEITPKMRESILKKGFAAYADGGEVEGYADGGDVDPERVREYLKRIQSPLSSNPESVQRALQIAQSYRGKTGMETGTGSFYNIKQSMPVSDVRSTIGDIPGISLKKEKPLSWDKFHDIAKGGSLINMGGDLSNFGRLTHINDKELAWPVDLHAGAKYMREPNPGQVWRNNKSHATGFMNKIKAEEGAGRDVYGILSPMGPTAVNSSHNMFDALMAQIPTSSIKKADLEAFDQALLNGEHLPADVRKNPAQFARAMQALDQWPGIANAKATSEYARPKAGNLSGSHRSLIVDFMDKSRWRDRGFPEVGVTRAAITDPALKGISGNLLGHRVVKLSSKDSEQPELFDHSTYEKPSFGEYVGDVPLTQRHYVMPDVVERMIANPTQKGQVVHPYSEDAMGRSTARKLFEEQKQVQPINQRMLDSVMMGEENKQKYGFKKGGKVRSALMIAKGLKKR